MSEITFEPIEWYVFDKNHEIIGEIEMELCEGYRTYEYVDAGRIRLESRWTIDEAKDYLTNYFIAKHFSDKEKTDENQSRMEPCLPTV